MRCSLLRSIDGTEQVNHQGRCPIDGSGPVIRFIDHRCDDCEFMVVFFALILFLDLFFVLGFFLEAASLVRFGTVGGELFCFSCFSMTTKADSSSLAYDLASVRNDLRLSSSLLASFKNCFSSGKMSPALALLFRLP